MGLRANKTENVISSVISAAYIMTSICRKLHSQHDIIKKGNRHIKKTFRRRHQYFEKKILEKINASQYNNRLEVQKFKQHNESSSREM